MVRAARRRTHLLQGIFILLLAACAGSGGLEPPGGRPFGPPTGIEVELETAAFRSPSETPVLHVHASFPRNRLLFQRAGGPGGDPDRWSASYLCRVVIRDEGGDQVGGGTYPGEVVLPPGARREDPGARIRFFETFDLPEGRWEVIFTVEDEGSIRTGRAQTRASAPAGAGGRPGISDIELLTPAPVGDHRVRIGGHLPHDAASLCFRYEVYGLTRTRRMRYAVVGTDGALQEMGSRTLPAGGHTAVTDSVGIVGLGSGTWTLALTLEGEGPASRKDFRIRRPLLEQGADREAGARQMALYAADETVERFRALGEEARIAFVDSLWREVDPTPGTERNEVREEFSRRLEAAEERWGARGRAGWDTDPGRVYVAYGAPDEELEERAVITPRGPLDEPREVRIRRWVYRAPAVTFTFEVGRDGRWVLRRDLSTAPPPAAGSESSRNHPIERS